MSASALALCLVMSSVYSFQVLPYNRIAQNKKLSNTAIFVSDQSRHEDEKDERRMEFMDLEPIPETETRKERVARDIKNQEKFAEFGDELWNLRNELQELSLNLINAINDGTRTEEEMVREKLRDAERRDPELTYEMEVLEVEIAQLDKRFDDVEKHKKRALAARSCLPQFNLDGLWVGKYGSHGYEMINITYVGDTLIASKVTGDKNVPRSEITFEADLSPIPKSRERSEGTEGNTLNNIYKSKLEPILLTEKAAKKWGTQQLPRYRGLGQVAESGFKNSRWMDGQLIMIGKEYFSFAWVPIEQQIFFGRPSPELALKMLREGGCGSLRGRTWEDESPPSIDADVDVLKAFASKCLEKTDETIEQAYGGTAVGCIFYGDDSDECAFE